MTMAAKAPRGVDPNDRAMMFLPARACRARRFSVARLFKKTLPLGVGCRTGRHLATLSKWQGFPLVFGKNRTLRAGFYRVQGPLDYLSVLA
jgi:hypothetical protein